ncbi:aminotransferase class I/II-fold pyridoxal phosphate-dependent enzyme [Cardiobacteriales bacterium ML27]|uniref:Aminotransferase class I/II-fold pyridoxal phosphate-dependent enzyme n=1 Tax=Ostreibacterium oceani TaxID=2654998 RepID=A0A6N7EVJ2_9GAMM|nr:aminotransferase class I/II-fold pyridoxal phosphate-dependent enzyme [Ostreibacterium oceani]
MVEAPGYYPLFSKLEMAHIKLIPWARSINPDLYQLETILEKRKPKILFFQPYAHNPTGGSMSEKIVDEICEICHRHQTIVVIDDPFAHILNNSHAYWPHAIYLSSFSKTLSASLRCGYVIADEHCINSLLKLKTVTMVNTSAFNEAILYDIMISGKYEQHLCALKQHLSAQAAATLATLGELKPILKISPYSDGLYLWVKLPSHISDMQLAEKSAKAGIFLSPGKLFYPAASPYPALRLNVAYSADNRLVTFLRQQLINTA